MRQLGFATVTNQSRNGTGGNGHRLRLKPRRPVAVDLFAGAGGLSLGFESAGFDVLTSVEYDPVHAATHEFNFPLTQTLCADVSELDVEQLRSAAADGWRRHRPNGDWDGEIDAVFGGPPCQGFSFIGKRLVDDPRNRLVFHFLRVVSELRPRYFVMENVPGMTRGGHAGILRQLIREFGVAGYNVVEPYRVLNAAAYGVPQERKRLFLIGAREGEPLPAYPSPTVQPVAKRPIAARLEPTDHELPIGPTVWDAVGDLPDLDDYEELKTGDSVRLAPDRVSDLQRQASPYARRLRGLDRDPSDQSHPRDWDRAILTGSTRTAHTDLSIYRFDETPQGETEPVSRFYRLALGGLCNTLRAGSGSERGAFTSPRPIHPTLPRVLSVREAARLHSFPDWFRLHETKWHGFRQIGNAVAPLVGRSVASQLVSAMRIAPPVPTTCLPPGRQDLLRMTMRDATDYYGVDKSSIPAPRTRGAKAGIARADQGAA